MHVDFVENRWHEGYQEAVGRIEFFYNIGGGILEEVSKQFGNGSYLFATLPHPDEDCPFKDSPKLYMTSARAAQNFNRAL